MGVIRGVLLVLVTVLLFLSILCANLFWVLTISLNYDNVQKESTILVKDFLKEINVANAIAQIYPLINFYCKNYSEYVFNYQGYTFDIPCNIISQGQEAIIGEGIKDLVRSVYYAKYDCNFLDCPNKSQIPLFLISEKSHDFWENSLYISLTICLVLLVLAFLLVEKKANFPILAGSLFIISSLIFIKLDFLFALLSNNVIFKILGIFFSQTYSISLNVLIIGVALVALGIILKIFKVGFFVSNLINKFKKEKETTGEKQKQQKIKSAKKPRRKRR